VGVIYGVKAFLPIMLGAAGISNIPAFGLAARACRAHNVPNSRARPDRGLWANWSPGKGNHGSPEASAPHCRRGHAAKRAMPSATLAQLTKMPRRRPSIAQGIPSGYRQTQDPYRNKARN
jgi:hypothetical protein